MKTTVIVLSAGQGKRMLSSLPKQYLQLAGKPILYHSLVAFERSKVDEIVLVVGKGDIDYVKERILSLYPFSKITKVIEGGEERYHSVYEGLKSSEGSDYVLIHDGARPLITNELIQKMIDSVKRFNACVIGTLSKDTIKLVNDNQEIIQSPNRSYVWNVQTPQAFQYDIIRKAYDMYMQDGSYQVTDDAMIVENTLKYPVTIVEGSYKNIKITTPVDLTVAESILKEQMV